MKQKYQTPVTLPTDYGGVGQVESVLESRCSRCITNLTHPDFTTIFSQFSPERIREFQLPPFHPYLPVAIPNFHKSLGHVSTPSPPLFSRPPFPCRTSVTRYRFPRPSFFLARGHPLDRVRQDVGRFLTGPRERSLARNKEPH